MLVVGVDDLDPDGSLGAIARHMEEASVVFTAESVARGADDDFGVIRKQTLLALNKIDLGEADLVKDLVRPVIGDIPIHEISCKSGAGLEDLRRALYEALSIVRVYTKTPGKKADLSKPYVVRRGTTVLEMARLIHKDFAERLRFARLWGHTRFEGQPVEKTHVLADKDVIELHI
jgi:ribosome-interacting GTPase 1